MNIAYDRISEDVILLYDAMRAYNQVSPRFCSTVRDWKPRVTEPGGCTSVFFVYLTY